MARNDAEMTAVRVEADADDADLEGKRMEASEITANGKSVRAGGR